MKLIFASPGTTQTGGFVCGSVTLYAAHLASLISLDKWTSSEVTTAIRKGSEGRSIGSVFDEDYVESAREFNLDITNQFIADGTAESKHINPIIIKSNQMMALTCAANRSVGHHMFIAKHNNRWYWLESLPCDNSGRRADVGTGCMRIFANSKEFEEFFVSTVTGYNWSLRGISVQNAYLIFPDETADGTYTWSAYTLPCMTDKMSNPIAIHRINDRLCLVANIDIPKFSIIPLFGYQNLDGQQHYRSKLLVNDQNEEIEIGGLGLFLRPFFQTHSMPNSILREFPELRIATDLWSGYVIQTTCHIMAGECIIY